MIIKKISMIFSLIICLSPFILAVTNENNQEYEKNNKNDYYKYLKSAKKYYLEGNFDKAETFIDKVFECSVDNEKANELRNKILLLKEKENYYKKYLVNDLLIELRRAIKEGNCYEGFFFVKKIKAIDPDKNLDSFVYKLNNEKEMILYSIENSTDKRIFLDSINFFVQRKFQKSLACVYKLYIKNPRFIDYVVLNRCYSLQETTDKRAIKLYNQAVKNLKARKLGAAREYAEMAYNLQPDNVKLKLLLEQINIEIL